MPVDRLENISNQKPEGVALLGLDIGKKTIGLAVSNPAQTLATPLETIRRTKFTRDAEALLRVMRDYETGGFVIGLPLNMDGSENRRCQSVRDFALEFDRFLQNHEGPMFSPRKRGFSDGFEKDSRLHKEKTGSDPWIALWDERFSTEAVEELVDQSLDIGKAAAKAAGITDALAARHILQTALDFMAQRTG